MYQIERERERWGLKRRLELPAHHRSETACPGLAAERHQAQAAMRGGGGLDAEQGREAESRRAPAVRACGTAARTRGQVVGSKTPTRGG